MSSQKISLIKTKLNEFRRKFYLNQVIRGGVVLALLFSTLFVTFAVSEGFFWTSTAARTVMFSVLALASAGVFGAMVVYPGLKYFNIGKTMTDAEAAQLIGKHFGEVDDKLLNLLQLAEANQAQSDLLLAAIQAKTEQMRPIPFATAINFQPNWRLARYIAAPLLLLLLIFLISPDVVTKGSYRLVNFSEHFTPPPPFTVEIPNHKDKLVDGESYTVNIKLKGDEMPGQLYMYIKDKNDLGFQKYALDKKNLSNYNYTFKNVRTEFEYYVGNDLYGAEKRGVEVLQRPSMNNFFVVLHYPAYTGLPAETLASNVGDFSALYGTRAEWNFTFKGPVKTAQFLGAQAGNINLVKEGVGLFSKPITENQKYSVVLSSPYNVQNIDTVRYGISVVADKHPGVVIQSPQYESNLPASGIIPLVTDLTDDYGFSRAEFHFRFLKSNDPSKAAKGFHIVPLGGLRAGNVLSLEQGIDFYKYGAEAGDEIEYFVKVWDNDGVTGPKSATSVVHKITYQTTETLYEQANQSGEEFDNKMDEALKDADDLQKNIEEMQRKLLEKKNLSYEDKKQLNELLEKQKDMMRQMEQAKEKLQDQIEKAEENNLYTPEVMEKLNQLEKMMQDLNTPEFQKFLEKMQKDMENMDNQQLKKMMEELQKDSEAFKEQIERTMELFKQLKVQQKVEEMVQKLDNMEKRQDMLQDKLDEAKTKEEQKAVEEKQKKLNQDMKNLQKDLQDLKDLKKDTQTPDKEAMDKLEDMGKDAQEEMEKAGEQMEKGQKQKAQKSQKEAKDQMKQMKEEMQKMQQNSAMQQQAENMNDLRALLENLIKLSTDQEALRDDMKKLKYNDPSLNKLIQKQSKLRDDMTMVEDSLVALSKRVFQIEKFITDELKDVNSAMKRAAENLNEKKIPNANSEQHRIMTGQNNLANMLLEALQQMQQQMKQMKQGAGQACPMPSPGAPSMQQLSKEQQMLNEKMGELMKKMGGKQPGGSQPNGKPGSEGMEGELGEMAKKQAEIRKKMEDMLSKMQGEQGKNGLGSGNKIGDDMKQTEDQLKNKQLTHEMMQRQQQILSRMLDYDKAMREREFDNKRKSKTGVDQKRNSPAELTEEELQQRIRKEHFHKDKFQYTPAYQNLIDDYYKLLDNKK